MRIIRPGSRGEDVRDVQQRIVALGGTIEPNELEGLYGQSTEAAVRAFQQKRGLLADGMVGPETWGALVESGYEFGDRTLYLRIPYFRGDDVRALQRRLNALGFDTGREDGIFGPQCDQAVRDFQKNVGREADGIVGPETYQALARLRPPLDATGRAHVREAASLREDSTIQGAVVAIDAGHGGKEPGTEGPGGLVEAEATLEIAQAALVELARRGAKPTLLRAGREDPAAGERAKAANDRRADICISIHLNDGDPTAEGAACMYFGTDESVSPAGQRLAETIQEELTSRLGLRDGRTHAMTIAILRETRMPAVQVEPCFITNPREEELLREPAFVKDVAIAIASGVERYFLPENPG
ncbi:MAG: N-acetylmuramoyl-L-alanine amidase [Actinomycetota bacterium]